MVEFLFSGFIGMLLGVLFFVSAKRYAHKEYETSWLWMLLLFAAASVFGFLDFSKPFLFTFLGCTALTASILTVRKIFYHRRSVNRRPFAQRYGNWLIYFWLIWAVIFTLWMLF